MGVGRLKHSTNKGRVFGQIPRVGGAGAGGVWETGAILHGLDLKSHVAVRFTTLFLMMRSGILIKVT